MLGREYTGEFIGQKWHLKESHVKGESYLNDEWSHRAATCRQGGKSVIYLKSSGKLVRSETR